MLAAARPLVLVPPTEDRARLRAALDRAQPWDVAGDPAAAVDLAASLAPGPRAHIFVWTDAARSPVPSLPTVTGRVLGTASDNVGIVGLRVVRDAGFAQALVRVTNFGRAAVRVPLAVTRDAVPVFAATLALQAGETRTAVFPVPPRLPGGPGRGAGAGVLRARLDVHDALPDDDTATALDAPPLPSVLLVGPDDPPLEQLLRVAPVARAAATRDTDPAAWRGFDVVILDGVRTGPVPPGRYLLIDTVPPNLPAGPSGTVATPDFATWEREDPILRFVDFGDVHVRRALRLAPEAGRVLAAGSSPLLWAYDDHGIRALVLAFALADSDLPRHVAVPVLIANGLAWLGGDTGSLRAGETVDLPAAGATQAVVVRPDGTRLDVRARDDLFSVPLPRAGVYRVVTAAGERVLAVAVGSDAAGRIAPGTGAAGPGAGRPSWAAVKLPVWPWLVLLGIAVALGEWTLATRRHGGDA